MSFIVGDPIQAAQLIAAGVAAYKFCSEQMNQMKLQMLVSDQYYTIFRQQRAFYRAVFQYGVSNDVPPEPGDPVFDSGIWAPSAAAEELLRAEALAETRYVPDYAFLAADVTSRQADYVLNILFHFNNLPTSLSRRHERMQLRPDFYSINHVALTVAATGVDSTNYWYRWDEYNAIVHDERRFEHTMNSINYGMKRANSVNSGLAMSMDVLGSARTRMADMYGKASNTFAGQLGYGLTQMRGAGPSSGGMPGVSPMQYGLNPQPSQMGPVIMGQTDL